MKNNHIRLYQWKALLYKDLHDLKWNGQVLFIWMVYLIVVSLSTQFLQEVVPLSFIIAFILGMMTMIMQGNLIVEEQEQATMNRLKQAGFSLKEVYYVKTFVTMIPTSVLFILFFIFNDKELFVNFKILILVIPLLIMMLVTGTWLGMKTKNTVEVSLYGIPIIILYFFIEGLLMNSDKGEMPLLVVFPNYHLHYGINQISQHEPFFLYLVVPLIWMVSVMLTFTHVFNKEKTNYSDDS